MRKIISLDSDEFGLFKLILMI